MIQLNWGLKRAYRRIFPRYGITSPIAVHSLPKTGTTSTVEGLHRLRLNVLVYHTHDLRGGPDRLEERLRSLANPDDLPFLSFLATQRAAREHLERWHGRPWNLVSMVRDPVSRNISDFFESKYRNVRDHLDLLEHGKPNIPQVCKLFLDSKKALDHSDWFDRQMRDVFGIDVYAIPFPKGTGYAIYEGRRARLLLMRLENFDSNATEAFRRFLNIPKFQPVQAYVGEEKHYADLYRRFKREAFLPESYLDQQFGSRLARHFYTDAELQQFKRKWMRDTEVATV
ncbi:putative capsular polysaccharide synthesis family protein [Tautonia plasticadhaerens]|uniref:Capsular polysaccharide synthesis protein n=1 Tax=Tautonia plasticadhaerens TaxID=2527974 RepID=A0A518GUZ2_9BACT|nr:putative capsular polysaccharide synthesis family protein [Tautonia plasticadhaerens]QDV32405.1 Putative capsular polysaccharide synthesis protein [Tautonia plasticadhaerens]